MISQSDEVTALLNLPHSYINLPFDQAWIIIFLLICQLVEAPPVVGITDVKSGVLSLQHCLAVYTLIQCVFDLCSVAYDAICWRLFAVNLILMDTINIYMHLL